jgi:glycerol-3-phosphate O-acyltransferase
MGLRRTIIDAVFGDPEAPGRLRELLGFLWRSSGSHFHAGAPVNLQTVLAREGDTPTAVIAKKIRWSILHHLAREEAIRLGPIQRPAARTHALVLNDPAVQRVLAPNKGEDGAHAERKRRAEQIVRRLAADMRQGWLRVLDVIIDKIWNDIYDGIVVDDKGLERVWSAARRGPVVLVPSHKSHVDYLVLSQVFFKDGMMPPHIAAGDNLSFWPLGPILRHGGAFFIRRSFGGDKLYAAICAAYVKRLLKDGVAVEFFIEGGRSRSGKLLPPKMGILGMCVDPVLDGSLSDVSFIPVSISYEKIIEAKSYARELEGGQKSKENVGALLSARKVLRSRYGRVYVDFDDPISLLAFAAARGIELRPAAPSEEPPPESAQRKNLVAQLGHRIVFGINRVTRVTPTGIAALVLLAQTRAGMSESELQERAEWLVRLLGDLGARTSPVLGPASRRDAIREALGRLAQDGLLQLLPAPDGENVYRLEDAGRRALDFYKNNVVHFLIPLSIVAVAVLARGEATEEEAREGARRLSRLLKFEFSFAVDSAFDRNFDLATESLLRQRILERRGERLAATPAGTIHAEALGGQIAVFLEGYRAVAEWLATQGATPRTEKEVHHGALALAKRRALEGKIKRAEAASQLTVQNGLRLLLELDLVARAEGGRVAVKNGDGLRDLIAELDRWLGPVRE